MQKKVLLLLLSSTCLWDLLRRISRKMRWMILHCAWLTELNVVLAITKDMLRLGGFYAPQCQWQEFYPIFDVRVHRIDDGRVASNVGIGLRRQFCDAIMGVNAYYDFRDTRLADYHQLGVGGELFTPYLDLRVNGYYPIGPRRRHHSTVFPFLGGFKPKGI